MKARGTSTLIEPAERKASVPVMARRDEVPIGPPSEGATRDEGVRCPRCNCRHTPAVKVRHSGNLTRRTRKCRHCGKEFIERAFVEPDSARG